MALCLKTPFVPAMRRPTSTSTSTAAKLPQRLEVRRFSCRKKEVHPEFYEDARVYCNGELVMTTGGTQPEYTVDVWSGNHPFYLGNRSAVLLEDDQVEKFRKKYGQLSSLMQVPVLKGEIVLPPKKKSGPGKGKGKK